MGFDEKTIRFLKQLARNNRREWFQENKPRYEDCVRTPALNFIEAMSPRLEKLSGCVLAEARKVGGSLMRPYRDTRFAKDAPPIKTNIGIQFRHRMGKDVHAPGWYVHIEPWRCFLGAGVWHPDSAALTKIRAYIDQHGKSWESVLSRRSLSSDWSPTGEQLVRPPRGYSADHPFLKWLKYKDHILVHEVSGQDVVGPQFESYVAKRFRTSLPFMVQLCEALGLPF